MAGTGQKTAGADTREALILAAERLIAEYGIDGVSLRQINTEAGQRNSSAAHYHFGSKDALIHSIYEHRLGNVNLRRQRMLDALRADGQESDVRRIIEAIVRPIVDEIEDSEGGSFYIRFLAQAMGSPRSNARDYWKTIMMDAAATAYAMLGAALPDVGTAIIGQRFGLMWELIIHSLADRERYREANPATEKDAGFFVANLIDTVAGAMCAPVSAETRAARPRRAGCGQSALDT